jgi:uncharacterized membrane protein YebE (DUF533 family)
MLDPDDLVDGVLRGVLGGRRKRSKKAMRYLGKTGRGIGRGIMSNPNALLTVAGVAWGIFETMQNSGTGTAQGGSQWGGGSNQWGGGSGGGLNTPPAGAAPPPTPQNLPPLPDIPGAAAVPPDALRMIRLAIAAASADGTLADEDRARILEQARAAGSEHVVEYELQNRRPLAEIVAGITDPAQRATLYVLAFGIIRADESVSGSERIFLAQLANQLGLDPATVTKLESDAAAKIDAQNLPASTNNE